MSIVVEQLHFAYGQRSVLRGVSFSAEDGCLLAVLGPNGAGKTTLFRCILGLMSRYEGRILVDGTDARTLPARALAHRIAYIPQVHGQAFSYSVLEMVLMGTTHGLSPLAVPKEKEKAAGIAALERLGIAQLAQKPFSKLSGGEQQLVLIARALAQAAHTLVMDEPTASLDYGNQVRVLEHARALAREGYAVVFSTHNPQHALSYADGVLALLEGEAAALGDPSEVMDAALLYRLYGVHTEFLKTENGILIAPRVGEGNA